MDGDEEVTVGMGFQHDEMRGFSFLVGNREKNDQPEYFEDLVSINTRKPDVQPTNEPAPNEETATPCTCSDIGKKRRRRRKPRHKKTTISHDDAQKPDESSLDPPNISKELRVGEANMLINPGSSVYDQELNSRWAQLKFGDLTITFNRRVRLPSDLIKPIDLDFNDDFDAARESYAQIVSSKTSQMRWKKELDWQTGLVLSQLDKWKEQYNIFSVSVDLSQPEQTGDGEAEPDKMKARILINRLKKILNEFFRGVVQIEEVVVWLDGSKHQSIYFGPTKGAVERELVPKHLLESKSGEAQASSEPRGRQRQARRKNKSQRSNLRDAQDDSFIILEDKVLRKQEYSSKRKNGKASKRRGRLPAVSPEINKNEMALMESKSAPQNPKNVSEDPQIKRHIELHERKSQRKGTFQRNLSPNTKTLTLDDRNLVKENEAGSSSKRIDMIQANFRRFMRRLSKEGGAKNDSPERS